MSSPHETSPPFKLALWRSPRPQRRHFLATREIAPQSLDAAIHRDLAHLGAGTAEPVHGGVRRTLFHSLRALWGKVATYAILSRIALLAAVWASSRLFEAATGALAALAMAGGYLAFQLIGGVFSYLTDATRGQLALAVELNLATVVNAKLRRLAPARAAAFSSGNLKNLVTSDVQYFSEYVASLVWNMLPALVSVLILGPAVYLFAGLPGLVGIAVAFLNVPIAILFSKLLERAQTKKQERLDVIATLLGEWLRNVRLARYLGWQETVQRDVARHLRQYMKAFMGRHFLMCVTFGISFAWWMLPVASILVAGDLLGRPVDLKGFFTTLWIIKDLAGFLQHLPHSINLHASAAACQKRVEALLAAPEMAQAFVPSPEGARPPSPAARPKRVRLLGVSAGYGERDALRSLTLDLDLGRHTAVVGAVGAGKTTLLRLLCAELPPSAGRIEVEFDDGTRGDLWEERVQLAYPRHLAYVPQEPFISNSTLATNVSLEEMPLSEDLVQAAYLAELEADVKALRRGFEEPIGETGVNLSGGQKQRVNLARAFHARRAVMLLDDPLSAVDARTEKALVDAIAARAEGYVLVSHRLGELQRVDRVIVLDDGAVVEDGAPAALLSNRSSRYARLVEAGAHVETAPLEAPS